MTILIQARAYGRPRTKGSLRGVCTRNRSHTIHYSEEVEDSPRWRKIMARALREAQLAEYGRLLQHEGPVKVTLNFPFARPDGAIGQLPFPTHITLGDLDKLTRNALDALSTPKKREQFESCSALLADDSQVVRLDVAKWWASEDIRPGVHIIVETVEESS